MSDSKLDNIREDLAQCYCTSGYHSYLSGLFGLNIVLTDGALRVAERCDAFWLLDVIYSYQYLEKLRREDFQVWTLTLNKDDGGGKVTCTDGNDNLLLEQELDYTDFPLPEGITLWQEGDVILLPREH
jgi:hypothetical protein